MSYIPFFFFLMIRRPPRSPLFPTPTPSRSELDVEARGTPARLGQRASEKIDRRAVARVGHSVPVLTDAVRSEEHTSELQSQSNLVCRLLLEKKKINTEVRTLVESLVRVIQVQMHVYRRIS